MNTINGKVALVTGGLGAICSKIILELLKNKAKGVAILDVTDTKSKLLLDEIEGLFGANRAIFIKTDITNKTELKNAFETTIKEFNQLDLVVNGAGIIDEINWERSVAINLMAVIEGTHLALYDFLPKYKSSEEAVIINIASVLGLNDCEPQPVYTAAKHAVVGFGRSLGRKNTYEKFKVRILTLCPSLVDTDLVRIDLLTKKVRNINILNKFYDAFDGVRQKPENVGKAVVDLIEKGENGSVWVTEDNLPVYEVNIPYYRDMKV